eukprot:826504-Rhodomonas_salina.1
MRGTELGYGATRPREPHPTREAHRSGTTPYLPTRSLRAYYAISGTEIAYCLSLPTRVLRGVLHSVQWYLHGRRRGALRVWSYGVRGTYRAYGAPGEGAAGRGDDPRRGARSVSGSKIAYAAMRCPHDSVWCYAVSGSKIAYAAMRSLRSALRYPYPRSSVCCYATVPATYVRYCHSAWSTLCAVLSDVVLSDVVLSDVVLSD